MSRLLIIGGSDAGISAALRARELDPSTDVDVVLADAYPNYSICGIPYYVSGDVRDWRDLVHRTIGDLEATGMRLHLDTQARRIDVEQRWLLVTDSAGTEKMIGYDKLVVGTGAGSIRPPIEQEVELRRTMEAVAAARRNLPPGGVAPEDYVFLGAGADDTQTEVRLSGLFAPGKDALVIYSFMFPRDPGDERPGPASGQTALLQLEEGPCPSCVALLDQLDGAAEHALPLVNLAVVAKAPLARIVTFAEERGWRRLQLLSSADNGYNADYLAETAGGAQRPMLNVFHREGEVIRHFWGSELFYAPTDPGQDPRHVGTLEPFWNLLDLTPEGRPSHWDEQLSYP